MPTSLKILPFSGETTLDTPSSTMMWCSAWLQHLNYRPVVHCSASYWSPVMVLIPPTSQMFTNYQK